VNDSTVAQEDQRWPEFDAKRSAEPTSSSIFHGDVPNRRVSRTQLRHRRLNGFAMWTPRRAKFKHDRPHYLIDFVARRLCQHTFTSGGSWRHSFNDIAALTYPSSQQFRPPRAPLCHSPAVPPRYCHVSPWNMGRWCVLWRRAPQPVIDRRHSVRRPASRSGSNHCHPC